MKASVCCSFQGDQGLERKQVVNIAMQQSVMNSYKLFGEHDDQIAFLVVDLLHFDPNSCLLHPKQFCHKPVCSKLWKFPFPSMNKLYKMINWFN